METVSAGLLEWGVAELVLPGQTESGDRYLVTPTPEGGLVAVVDGLGHGAEAAEAAKGAVRSLSVTGKRRSSPSSRPVIRVSPARVVWS